MNKSRTCQLDTNTNKTKLKDQIDNPNINDKNKKNFLNKKNVFIISFSLAFSILLFVLTIIFVLKIDFNVLFKDMGEAFKTGNIAYLWFFLLLLFIPIKFIFTYLQFTLHLKKEGINVKWGDKALYSLTINFLTAVTPANFVSDPYTIFWLKTQGLPTHKASALVLTNGMIWQLIQMIVTIPSFVILCCNYHLLLNVEHGELVFIFMSIGLCIDLISFGFFVLCTTNKHIHMYVSMAFNKLKKFLHMKYATPEQTKEKYLIKATLYQDIKKTLRDYKTTIILLIGFLLVEIYIYYAVYFAIEFIGFYNYDIDVNNIFNCSNVAITANKLIPIPGGECSIEWFLKTTIASMDGIKPKTESSDVSKLIDNGLLIWRAGTTYILMFFGIFGFIGITIKQILKFKNLHKNKK